MMWLANDKHTPKQNIASECCPHRMSGCRTGRRSSHQSQKLFEARAAWMVPGGRELWLRYVLLPALSGVNRARVISESSPLQPLNHLQGAAHFRFEPPAPAFLAFL